MSQFLDSFVHLGGTKVGRYQGITVNRADASLSLALEHRARQTRATIADACGASTDCLPCNSSYKLPGIQHAELPLSTGIFELITNTGYASSTTQWYSDEFYLSPRALCCTDDIPTLDTNSYCCETTGIATLVLAWKSCIIDWTQYCGPNGYELFHPEADLQRKVMEAMAYAASEIAFKGMPEENIIGLSNNKRFASVPMPDLFSVTPDVFLRGLSRAFTQIRLRQQFTMSASGTYEKLRLVLALPSIYHDLLDSIIFPGTHITLLQHLENRGCNPCDSDATAPSYRVSVVPIPELNTAGPNGEPVGFLFPLGSLQWIRPKFDADGSANANGSLFTVLPPYTEGLHTMQIVFAKVGSVMANDYTKVIKLRF